MTALRFRIVNVFAETALSGNALAVFEDGRALSDAQMQALALQLNLSETTFIFPSTTATAKVRIFTPAFEMPFAGHPTLGTAHVVRALHGAGAGDSVTLEMQAGIIPVTAKGDAWTLQANPPRARDAETSRADLARMLGIEEADIEAPPMWIDTGSDQLVVRLRSADAVRRCRPAPTIPNLVYVWASDAAANVLARFFFLKHGAVIEDPGTGSACANLGGWHVLTKQPLPISLTVSQGEATGRPCKLHLEVDAAGKIFVTGKVVDIGHGEIDL